ncbi:FTR1 family iron permease [Caloranaerobacter ferrireducens]|uniref:FTR1 family iron permease n=1 Tax=Caloranaerobacter ferrireducens TaxID=1323370 RepID=UPI00084D09E4|nr:FTR1 family protein [Caloranaerobacter ferrireducens]
MFSSFLLIFREGLEAALIIGIILGYLAKINKKDLNSYVYAGVGSAVLASGATAYLFEALAGGFEGRSEEIFEGIIMLIAVVILTSMIIWMKNQSKGLKEDLHRKIDSAVSDNKVYGLASLAFLSVYREGVEVVLFFKALSSQVSWLSSLIGSIIGLIAAIAVAYIIFKTTIKLNLQQFFKVTGGLIILIAAGLFAHGIHELQEAHVIPIIVEHLYNINSILNEKGTIGSILKAMFGYNGNPSLIEVISYWGYLGVVGLKYFKDENIVKEGA